MPNAVASLYANFFPQALAKNIHLVSDTLKMGLLSGSYTPFLATDTHWSDVDGVEISGSGYTAGGVTLTSVSLTLTDAGSWSHTWTAANPYTYGTVIRPTSSNGFLYRCVVAGTSGGSQPSFPVVTGQTVTDSGVTWACLGQDALVFTTATASWSSATFDAAFGVIYDDQSGTASTAPLIALIDFLGTQSPSAQTFTVPPDPVNGWFLMSPPS